MNILTIGDTHEESPGFPWAARNKVVAEDVSRMLGRDILDAVVQVGDHTTKALTAEFNSYKTWKSTVSLPAGVPFREVAGNHDLIGNNSSGTPDLVTPAQWATIFGQPSKDAVLDLGDNVRLLLVSPAADATVGQANVRRLTVDQATVAWLDARMYETDRLCLLFFHAPLEGTVGPLDGSAFSSYDERWRAHYDAGYSLVDLIGRHPNFVAWVSGHTHSRVNEIDIVKEMTYGTTRFAAISVGSPAFWNPPKGPTIDPIVTSLLTVLPDRIEIRYRQHDTGQWLDPIHTHVFAPTTPVEPEPVEVFGLRDFSVGTSGDTFVLPADIQAGDSIRIAVGIGWQAAMPNYYLPPDWVMTMQSWRGSSAMGVLVFEKTTPAVGNEGGTTVAFLADPLPGAGNWVALAVKKAAQGISGGNSGNRWGSPYTSTAFTPSVSPTLALLVAGSQGGTQGPATADPDWQLLHAAGGAHGFGVAVKQVDSGDVPAGSITFTGFGNTAGIVIGIPSA